MILSPLSIPFFEFVALAEKTKITDKNKIKILSFREESGKNRESLVVLSDIAPQDYSW